MADYFVHGSFTFPITAKQMTWLRKLIGQLDALPDYIAEAEVTPEQACYQLKVPKEALRLAMYIGAESTAVNNEYIFVKDGRKHYCHVLGDEQFDVEEAAHFCSAFLARFNPKGAIIFTWAETCSRPRPNSFSGGTAMATADRWIAAGADAQLAYLHEKSVGLEVIND